MRYLKNYSGSSRLPLIPADGPLLAWSELGAHNPQSVDRTRRNLDHLNAAVASNVVIVEHSAKVFKVAATKIRTLKRLRRKLATIKICKQPFFRGHHGKQG